MNSLRRILAIIIKELQVIFMQPAERRVIIIPPLVLMLVFSMAATRDVKNIEVGILNQDSGIWSQKAIEAISGAPSFRNVIFYQDFKEVQKALDLQKITMFIRFPDTFSRKVEKGESAEIQLAFDGRKAAATQIIQGYLNVIFKNVFINTLSPLATQKSMKMRSAGSQIATQTGTQPVGAETLFWFNPTLQYPFFYLPALICLLNLMVVILISELSVAREKELGTIEQILISPSTSLEIAIAKIIPGILIALIQSSLFLFQAFFIFNIPFEGSLLMFYAGDFIFSIGIGAIGLSISVIANTQQQAFLGGFTLYVPLILLSGFAAPVDNMPIFLQYISELNPMKHYLNLIHGIFLKDITWAQSLVYFWKMITITLITIPISLYILKKGN